MILRKIYGIPLLIKPDARFDEKKKTREIRVIRAKKILKSVLPVFSASSVRKI
jgi:hypothetical protein